MSENKTIKTREKWVDYVKVIACILVVLGHFFQSMVKANIILENDLYHWFNTTIYYFHVPLFFICSGYLYQKYSKVDCLENWYKNIKKKVIALGIPYFIFSTVTWILKKLFSNVVNDEIGSLSDILLFHPTAPYWFLFALFFIFCVTPTFRNKKECLFGLIISIVAKLLILIDGEYKIYVISIVLANEIWFILGMSICLFNINLNCKRKQGIISFFIFIVLSIIMYRLDINNGIISFFAGLLACISIIFIIYSLEDKKEMDYFAKYTMPIFLMHTLFAAPLRSVLFRLSIKNTFIHIVFGISISFIGPIVATFIMEKFYFLEFFLYPNKILKNRINT